MKISGWNEGFRTNNSSILALHNKSWKVYIWHIHERYYSNCIKIILIQNPNWSKELKWIHLERSKTFWHRFLFKTFLIWFLISINFCNFISSHRWWNVMSSKFDELHTWQSGELMVYMINIQCQFDCDWDCVFWSQDSTRTICMKVIESTEFFRRDSEWSCRLLEQQFLAHSVRSKTRHNSLCSWQHN